ncbi:hypothetical protein O6H91_06G058300 [Diphasiastrum complanatum]|uniref:Uncharacterized protein n=1 Tax=Diphasiastrum complanatum TaxID=34168 RepID=A0ACC2DDX7_DIPCM|nr:hypothetical protein O6H91_06G058300 [Diphasiastrum complanatum]
MVGYALSGFSQKPSWLEALLSEKFFVNCSDHSSVRKNERNVFCVDCSGSICQHCLSTHVDHRLLQIRRYVYHDVIRLQDIQKLVDCGHVQPYIINSARVVFLNQRPQPRQSKVLGNTCLTCERTLQDSYHFCSVACKVDAILNSQGKDLSSLLPHCSNMHFPKLCSRSAKMSFNSGDLELERELSPNSTLDEPRSQTSSGSTTANDDAIVYATSSSNTTFQPLKKMRSSLIGSSLPKTVILGYVSRRKGIPHRSPLC